MAGPYGLTLPQRARRSPSAGRERIAAPSLAGANLRRAGPLRSRIRVAFAPAGRAHPVSLRHARRPSASGIIVRAAALPPPSILGEVSEGAVEAPSDQPQPPSEKIRDRSRSTTG